MNSPLVNWEPWSVFDDIRLAVAAQRLLQGFDAEVRVHGDRYPMGQRLSAGPVEDHAPVDKAPGHRHVGDIQGPNRIGSGDGQAAQQVGIDLVGRMLLAGPGTPVEGFDAHAGHQRGHMAAPDPEAFPVQGIARQPSPHEGVSQVQLVDPPHQRQVGVRHRPLRVVGTAPADAEQFHLPGQGNFMVAVDQRFALSFPALLSAPDKKSISSACWPILACRALRSTAGPLLSPSPPNTLAARSRSWLRHSPICVG